MEKKLNAIKVNIGNLENKKVESRGGRVASSVGVVGSMEEEGTGPDTDKSEFRSLLAHLFVVGSHRQFSDSLGALVEGE